MKKIDFTLYPAIDVKNGKCVRLLYGDMDKETVYNKSPLDQAMWFVDQGAEWLHIVDLDGAIKGNNVNQKSILSVLKTLQNKVKIQIGGGIRTRENIDFWLENSVDKVILGTVALENPDFINNLTTDYNKKIIVGADVRNGKIATHGWEQQSSIKATELLNKFNTSILDSVIYTDMNRDGSMEGVDLEQTLSFAENIPHSVIASGGVSSLEDISELSRHTLNGIQGVVIGRALYDKKFSFIKALETITKEEV